MTTKEIIIEALYNDTSGNTCHGDCKPKPGEIAGECCRRCAEKILKDHEKKVQKKAKKQVLVDLWRMATKEYDEALSLEELYEIIERLR